MKPDVSFAERRRRRRRARLGIFLLAAGIVITAIEAVAFYLL